MTSPALPVCDRCGLPIHPGAGRFGSASRHWECRHADPPEEPPLHVDSPGVQDGEVNKEN